MSSDSARGLVLALAALLGCEGAAAANADPVVGCQRAIEVGGRAFAAQVLRAASTCGKAGGGPFAACLESASVQARLALVRARWGSRAARACAGTNLRSDLGYLDTCSAPPSGCTFASAVLDAPGDRNDLLDCLACRIGETVRGAAVALFAGQPVSNRCHAVLARKGLKALHVLLAELRDCPRAGTTSIAGCLDGPTQAQAIADQLAKWRHGAEAACAAIDPFMTPGYPHYCSGQAPVFFGSECPASAPPCTFRATSKVSAHKNPNDLLDSEDENDLVDCLTCQVEDATLALARDLYGANVCCASDGCRTVRTRVGCRAVGGRPAYYRVDSVDTGPICGPHGITVGRDGTLYLADSFCDQVKAVSPQGAVRTLASGLFFPTGIAVDPAGNVYVSLRCENRVVRITPSGVIGPYAGTGIAGHSGDGGPATAAELVGTDGVAVDAAGNVYIPESGLLPLTCPNATLVSLELDHVRVVDPSGTIQTFAGAGPAGTAGEGGPALAAQLGIPYGVSVAADGSLLIGEAGTERVLRVDRSGVLTRVAGRPTSPIGSYSGDGGPAALARFYEACGVSANADGMVFIADMLNNRVRMVDPLGSIISLVGTGLASDYGPSGDGGPGLLAAGGCPEDVAVGPDGRVYYSDLDANRIRVLTLQRY